MKIVSTINAGAERRALEERDRPGHRTSTGSGSRRTSTSATTCRRAATTSSSRPIDRRLFRLRIRPVDESPTIFCLDPSIKVSTGRRSTAAASQSTPRAPASSCRGAGAGRARPARALRDSAPCPAATTARRRPAPARDRAGVRAHGDRLGPLLAGRDPGHLHGIGLGVGAALARGPRPRLGHRRVRDAARLDRRAQGARLQAGPPGRPRGRDPAADRPLAARRRRSRGARRALGLRRLRRPPGRRRHPLRLDHRRLHRAAAGARLAPRAGRPRARSRSPAPSPRSAAASSTARRSATSTTPRTPAPRSTPTSSCPATAASSRSRRPPSRPRSRGLRSTTCWRSPSRRSLRLRDAQEAVRDRSGRDGAARPRLVVATRNEHKLRELSQILPGVELVPLPDEVELPPETGETFAANALAKARAARAATGVPAIADDSGIAADGLGGRPGVRSARYAGEDASDEENLALLIEELGAHDDRRVAYVCALAYVDGDGEESVRGPLRGGADRRAARGGRLRLRPGGRPARHRRRRRAHDGRARATPRSTRSATAAAPRGSSRRTSGSAFPRRGGARRDPHQDRRGDPLGRLQHDPDRAQDRRRRDHRLDRDHHRGDPQLDRPDGLGDRAGLGPQGRRAARPRAPLRPREGREPGGGDRGDADPGRRRGDHLRGDPPARQRRRDRGPRHRHRRDRLLGDRQRLRRRLPLSPRPRARTRPRSRATPPTSAPTRSPRSASSPACCWSSSPTTRPSTRSPRSASPPRSSSPESGSSPAPAGCSSTSRRRRRNSTGSRR